MAKTRGYSKAAASRLAAVLAAGLAAFLLTPQAQAQKLQADPKANPANQPTINNSGSSKAPSVNIVKPNAGGVSHNVYTDFNVGKPGLVMNNATQAGQSQLLGQLGANPNLTSDPAKLILNEVTGGNISRLLGYTEIFGAKADFILANPAGVTCNGCGFINTPRVTLTTGTTDFDASGAFKGFSVTGSGSIRFEGTGASITGVETLDVVSRSIFMGGAIDDSVLKAEVGLFAGRNSFDYASRTVTALADDGSKKPGYGIDTNAAGAIRAGKIGVTSTEKGVAARAAQDMQAGAGGMMLTADGKLVIAKAHSQGAVQVKSLASDIQITGQLWSQASLDLWAGGNIAVFSQASAGALGNVSVTAQGISLNSGAVLGAGLDGQGKFTGSGSLNLYAADVTNSGTLKATQDINLALSGELNNQPSSSTTTIAWLSFFSKSVTTQSQSAGQIEAGRNLSINAAQVTNAGSMTAAQNAAFNVSGTLSNAASGSIHADGKLAVNAGSLENYGSTDPNGPRGTISGQMLVLNAGDIANAGNLLASQSLSINSSGQVLNALGTIKAGGYLSITAAGNLENLSGIIQGQETAINVQTIDSVTLVSRDGSLLLPLTASSAASTGTGGTLASLQAMFGPQNGAFLDALGLQLGGAAAAAPAQQKSGFFALFAVSNSGHTDVALQQAEISATNGLTLNAAKDIAGAGAKFSSGTDFIVNAGGNIAIGAQELTSAQGSVTTVSHVKSTISAGRDFILNAGGDAAIVASDINIGRNGQVVAQGGVTFGAAQDEYHEHSSHTSCDLFCFIGSHTDVINIDNVTPVPTTINAGGWVEARSKTKDVVATATTVNAQGNIALIADLGNISEVAGLGSNYSQSYSKSSYVFGLFGSSSGATSSSTVVAPSFVSAKGDLTYYAHGDLKIVGSGGQSGGTTYVTATNVNVTAVEQLIAQGKMSENWGLFASASAGNGTVGLSAGWKDTKTTSSELQSLWQAASLQAGGRLVINATGDVNVFGSTVTAAGGITVNAAQVNVTAAQDTIATQSNTTTDTIGLMPAMNNGLGFAIGAREVSDTGVQTTVASVGGLIGSTGGAVVINASEGINVQGGVIGSLQADSTILNAPSISVSASVDSFTAYALHTDKFVGLNVSIEAGAANPLSGVQKGASYLAAAENTKDPQAKLLYEAAAGAQGAQGLLNLYKAESAGSLAQAFASFDIKVGIGVAVSSSESTYHTEQASGGMVLAAKSAVLNATAGDLTLTGATVYAPSVTLSAQRDIVQQSLALNNTASSKSSSFSAFAGLDFGVGLKDGALAQTGFGLTASVSDFAAQSQTVSVTHAQTTVTGGFVSLSAGRDIDLYGAAVSGTGLAVQAGRNLNIVSDQDTERQTASLTSWNLGGTIGLTGMPSSFNAGYASGNASGNYTSVTATSGLFAGSGGYAVSVGGTTTLTGGAIASTADASKNSLTTGALVTKDLVNSSGWKASSSGMSASYSTGGIGGIQPGLSQKTGGSSSGVAQATIAPGTISIVNAALQKSLTGKTPDQIVAALNRASAAQNKAADALPGSLAQTLQNQADRSNAMMAASSSTAKLVGDVSSMLKASADETIAKYAKTPPQSQAQQDELDAAKLQASLWGEDGAARILVHGATQGVLAWIGGGYSLDAGLRGAGGAMAAAALAPVLKSLAEQLLKDAGIDDPRAYGPLANLISELAVTGIGSAFGNVGAVTAASVHINNFQEHLCGRVSDPMCEKDKWAEGGGGSGGRGTPGELDPLAPFYALYYWIAGGPQQPQSSPASQPSPVPQPHYDANGVPYYDTPVNGGFTDGKRYYATEADLQNATGGVAAVFVNSNTVTTRTNGNNTVDYTLDAQGNLVSVAFSLVEYFAGVPRSSAEIQAQAAAAALGLPGDQGGHYLDHRFMGDQGDINLFPQAGNFNLSAYKVLGNDYARFIDQGYTVQGAIMPGNFNGDRPSTVGVSYDVCDQQGNVVYSWRGQFQNQAGQAYVRGAP